MCLSWLGISDPSISARQAAILEVSLTDCPSNPQAIVTRRYRVVPLPAVEFYSIAKTAIDTCIRMVEAIGALNRAASQRRLSNIANTPPQARAEHHPMPRPSRSEFSKLVHEMNEGVAQ